MVVRDVDPLASAKYMTGNVLLIICKVINVRDVAREQDPHLALALGVDFDGVLRVLANIISVSRRPPFLLPPSMQNVLVLEHFRVPVHVVNFKHFVGSLPVEPELTVIHRTRLLDVIPQCSHQIRRPPRLVIWVVFPFPSSLMPRVFNVDHANPLMLPHIQHGVRMAICKSRPLLFGCRLRAGGNCDEQVATFERGHHATPVAQLGILSGQPLWDPSGQCVHVDARVASREIIPPHHFEIRFF
mmetsp:Transcript_2574/g.6225  ORF Transcript_2574/g.6225 Transcript_2574/m.6225 type:complete len:243 (-) Transcript_2574:461-1189(-)